MINSIARHFDLQSHRRQMLPQGHAAGAHLPVWPQYLIVTAGIILEPFLRDYVESGAWHLDRGRIWGQIAFGLIVGALLLPSIYRSTFDAGKPVAVQLAALLPLGIGWQSLVSIGTAAVAD